MNQELLEVLHAMLHDVLRSRTEREIAELRAHKALLEKRGATAPHDGIVE